jgi:membrane-bound lytic murein transglycosylase B
MSRGASRCGSPATARVVFGRKAGRGVRRDDGGELPPDGDVTLARTSTRRFLVSGNYDALLHYNCAHHYALAVGLLAARISDGL